LEKDHGLIEWNRADGMMYDSRLTSMYRVETEDGRTLIAGKLTGRWYEAFLIAGAYRIRIVSKGRKE